MSVAPEPRAQHVETLRRLKSEGIGFSAADHKALDAAIAALIRIEAGEDGTAATLNREAQIAGQEMAATHARILTEVDNLLALAIKRSNLVCPQAAAEGLWRERWIDLKAAHLMLHANEGYEIARADAESLADKMHAEFLDALPSPPKGDAS